VPLTRHSEIIQICTENFHIPEQNFLLHFQIIPKLPIITIPDNPAAVTTPDRQHKGSMNAATVCQSASLVCAGVDAETRTDAGGHTFTPTR
jgi:hypothetical protein